MSKRSYSLLEITLTGRQKHLINTTNKKSSKQEKVKKCIALRQENFSPKIFYCGPNVRYITPLHQLLHPVTPLQSKQL